MPLGNAGKDVLPRHVVESTINNFFVSRRDGQLPGLVYSGLNLSGGWWCTKCSFQNNLLCHLGPSQAPKCSMSVISRLGG